MDQLLDRHKLNGNNCLGHLLLFVFSDDLIATTEEPIKGERRRVCPDRAHSDFIRYAMFRNLLFHVRRLQEGLLDIISIALKQDGRIYVFLLADTTLHQIK